MLLSDARIRVRRLVDDIDSVFFADAEVDDALSVAQEECLLLAVGSGWTGLSQEADLTSSAAGAIDLTTLNPLKVTSVSEFQPGSLVSMPIQASRRAFGAIHAAASVQVRVTYVPRASFPANPAAHFVWGVAALNGHLRILDQYMCVVAASALKVDEGAENKGLERRKAELRESVLSQLSTPSITVMPFSAGMRGLRSQFQYISSGPFSLQLVLP